MGARNPPTFPPVLRIAQAAPTWLPATSIADAQNAPSHQDANPVASDSDTTAAAAPGTMVPTYSRRAPMLSPIMGTIRRPNFAPYDRVSRSEIHPPNGIMNPIVTKMMVVYLALW